MASNQFPRELMLVFVPAKGASSRQIPKAYTHFIAESEEHLNEMIDLKKNEIKQYAKEIERRWSEKYGETWKQAYRESIGHDFDEGIQAQLQLKPMAFEDFNQYIQEALLSPNSNPLKLISEDDFYDAFEALPAENVCRSNTHLSFTMPEMLVSSITSQYIKFDVEGTTYCASRLVDVCDESTFITPAEMVEFIEKINASRPIQEVEDPLADQECRSLNLSR